MTAMDALLDARLAWERSQPQLFLELEPLEETPRLRSGVSSSGPFPEPPLVPPGGRSTTHDGGPAADLGQVLRGRAAEGA